MNLEWKRKQGRDISHLWDVKFSLHDLHSQCNQASAYYKDLRDELENTRRCQLCTAKLDGADRLAKLREAWDDGEKP